MEQRGNEARGARESAIDAGAAAAHAWRHLRLEGFGVALAFLLRALRGRLRLRPRDPGERATERFLKSLGYRILARNWRSPRDPRDEADLVAATPDGTAVAVVEVKRARGPWDPLARVDERKRAALWRLAGDLSALPESEAHPPPGRSARKLARAVADAGEVRIDLVAVQGVGRTASVIAHVPGIASRRPRGRGPQRPP